MATPDRPEVGKIGVGAAAVISNSKGQILVGKRKGGFGDGEFDSNTFVLHQLY